MNDIVKTLATIGKLVSDFAYPIEDGCLENLDYEPHARGKNWIAFVTPNRAAPGGLDREFWKHGSGRWYKALREIKPFDVIEMGGDYYTGRGSKRADRRYVLVVTIEPDAIIGVHIGNTAPSTKRVAAEVRDAKAAIGIAA